MDIANRRLISQQLATTTKSKSPRDVVEWLGAVQAQDYPGAKWALGLRLRGATDAVVERAFAKGTILRTHLLRPTWHFVSPADIRWLLALTAPRVQAANAYVYRKLELDGSIFRRTHAALAKALDGGQQLTRDELRVVLDRAGVRTDGEFRMGYLMMCAELEGIVCSGPRRGKQFTYALLDERVRSAKSLDRDEGLSAEGEPAAKAAYGRNYARLASIKKRYDPDNVFRGNPNIQRRDRWPTPRGRYRELALSDAHGLMSGVRRRSRDCPEDWLGG